MYVIVSADILAGHEGAPGLVCDLLGTRPSGWCGSRQLLAAVVAVCFMAPLITPKRLASTAITSWIGLVSELWGCLVGAQLGGSVLCCAVLYGRSNRFGTRQTCVADRTCLCPPLLLCAGCCGDVGGGDAGARGGSSSSRPGQHATPAARL